ncbi:MAG: DUF1761 domain-containing protein [Bacteroidota bacterium]|nr:DUF1761 domain-containing protein [Bacteroidota bacterium]
MNTDVLQHINWLSLLVAGLAYFFLGVIWYSFLFGKKWQSYNSAAMNAPDAKKGAFGIMFFSLILMLVCSFGLALIITRFNLSGWLSGVKIGLITGLCFAATAIHISYIYEKRPLGLHLINGLYNILGNIIAAVIIASWG